MAASCDEIDELVGMPSTAIARAWAHKTASVAEGALGGIMGDPSVWTRQLPAHTRPHSLGIVCAVVVGSRACDGASPLPGTGTSRRRRSHTLAATGCTLDWLAHSCCGHVCWGLQHGVLPYVQYGAYGLASPPPIPPSAARSTGSCIVLHVTLQRSSLLESPETLLLRRWHDDSLASPDVETCTPDGLLETAIAFLLWAAARLANSAALVDVTLPARAQSPQSTP